MPGSGKSTLGVLLAKALGYSFIDTDLVISRKAEMTLQKILDISESAMKHLKEIGRVVYIDVPFDEIERRVTNITTRGIAFHRDETLRNVYDNRVPLYEKYADAAIKVSNQGNIEDTVSKLLEALIFS